MSATSWIRHVTLLLSYSFLLSCHRPLSTKWKTFSFQSTFLRNIRINPSHLNYYYDINRKISATNLILYSTIVQYYLPDGPSIRYQIPSLDHFKEPKEPFNKANCISTLLISLIYIFEIGSEILVTNLIQVYYSYNIVMTLAILFRWLPLDSNSAVSTCRSISTVSLYLKQVLCISYSQFNYTFSCFIQTISRRLPNPSSD